MAGEVKALAGQTSEATSLIAEIMSTLNHHADHLSTYSSTLIEAFNGDHLGEDLHNAPETMPAPVPATAEMEPAPQIPEVATEPVPAPVEAAPDQPATLPGVTQHQKVLVQETFAMVEPIADQAVELFYNRLFETAP